MIIKTIARRNWPGLAAGEPATGQQYTTWYQPLEEQERITAAVSWVLAHEEVTGMAAAGDVRLLGKILRAERERMPVDAAVAQLRGVEEYSSPFVTMPF